MGIKRHDDETQTKRRNIEAHPIDAIGKPHRDAVARLEILAPEGLLERSRTLTDTLPRVADPALHLLVVFFVRNTQWRTLDTLIEKSWQGGRAVCADEVNGDGRILSDANYPTMTIFRQ